MIWIATRFLGCATAQQSGCWEGTIFVCHYDPVGNVNSAEYFQANVQ